MNEAVAKIRALAEESVNVYFIKHASDQMDKRGITQTQATDCLRRGVVVEGPTWDTYQQKGWKVTMESFCAGRTVGIAAKLIETGDSHVLVITAFKKGR